MTYQVLLPGQPSVFDLTLDEAKQYVASNPGARVFEFETDLGAGAEVIEGLPEPRASAESLNPTDAGDLH